MDTNPLKTPTMRHFLDMAQSHPMDSRVCIIVGDMTLAIGWIGEVEIDGEKYVAISNRVRDRTGKPMA